ncbi:transcription elongation factor spt5 [Conglomerata obtusa]
MKKRQKPTFVDIEASEDSSSYLDSLSEELDGLSSASSVTHTPRDWNKFTNDLANKYATSESDSESEEVGEEEGVMYVPQHALMPDRRSPRLWIVRVIRGKEREVACRVLSNIRASRDDNTEAGRGDVSNNRSGDNNNNNNGNNNGFNNAISNASIPTNNTSNTVILSVLVKPDLFGYIYIESYTKQAVLDSLMNTRMASKSRIAPVPLNEMIDCLTTRTVENIKPHSFARIKKGKYKNDIVQIISVTSSETVKVRVVPRLFNIPKLFNPSDFDEKLVHTKRINANISTKREKGTDTNKESHVMVYTYRKETYINGFLEKEVLIQNLLFDADITLEESKVFEKKNVFMLNDKVKVMRGDLVNLCGIIKNIERDEVEISICNDNNTNNNDLYRVNVEDIEKNYQIGDEVSFNGKNGLILSFSNEKVNLILTDTFNEEVSVYLHDLEPVRRDKGFEVLENRGVRIRRDSHINENVEIIKGEFKGYLGVIKDVYKDNCRIILDSNMKYVNVYKEDLRIINSRNNMLKLDTYKNNDMFRGKTPAYNRENEFGKTPSYGRESTFGKTPAYGRESNFGKTPAYTRDSTAKTPAYGRESNFGKTPAYTRDSSAKTPAYGRDNTFGKTPAYGRESNFGKTPAYTRDNTFGKTPAYTRDNTAKTPAYTRDNTAKTPAYTRDNTAKTPAYGREHILAKTPVYTSKTNHKEYDPYTTYNFETSHNNYTGSSNNYNLTEPLMKNTSRDNIYNSLRKTPNNRIENTPDYIKADFGDNRGDYNEYGNNVFGVEDKYNKEDEYNEEDKYNNWSNYNKNNEFLKKSLENLSRNHDNNFINGRENNDHDIINGIYTNTPVQNDLTPFDTVYVPKSPLNYINDQNNDDKKFYTYNILKDEDFLNNKILIEKNFKWLQKETIKNIQVEIKDSVIESKLENKKKIINEIREDDVIFNDGTFEASKNINYIYPEVYDKVAIMEGKKKGFVGICLKLENDFIVLRNEKGELVRTALNFVTRIQI